MWYTIILLLLTLVALVAGFALILDWWQPFKKEVEVGEGEKKEKKVEKIPLTSKEKWTVGAMVFSAIVALLSLLFATNPPWLEKWRERANNVRAKA